MKSTDFFKKFGFKLSDVVNSSNKEYTHEELRNLYQLPSILDVEDILKEEREAHLYIETDQAVRLINEIINPKGKEKDVYTTAKLKKAVKDGLIEIVNADDFGKGKKNLFMKTDIEMLAHFVTKTKKDLFELFKRNFVPSETPKNRVEKEVNVQTTTDAPIKEKPVVEPKNEVLTSNPNDEVELSLEEYLAECEESFKEFAEELRGRLVEGVPYKSNGTITTLISMIDDEKLLTQEFVSEFSLKHFKKEVKAGKYEEHMLVSYFRNAAEHYAYSYNGAFDDLIPLYKEAYFKKRLREFEKKKVKH